MKKYLAGLVAGVAAATVAVPMAVAAPVDASVSAATAGTVRSVVSLTAPAYGTYGTNVRFTGTAWRYNTQTKLAGATIVLQRSVHNKAAWTNLTSAKTAANGTFAVGVTLSGGYDYRAYYPGSPTYTTAVSAVKYPLVLQKVLLDSIATSNNAQATTNNGALTAKGRVFPAPPTGTRVWLQKYDAAGKTWKNFMSGKTSGSTITVQGDVPGHVNTYRLSVPTRYPYYTGSSNSKLFAHYVWRGMFTRPPLQVGGTNNPQFHDDFDTEGLGGFAVLDANLGGTAWADIRTNGCLTLSARVENISAQRPPATRQRVSILRDGKALRALDLNPGGIARFYDIPEIKGAAKLRIQVQDIGRTGGPAALWNTAILCSN
jgi:hypothetical protein